MGSGVVGYKIWGARNCSHPTDVFYRGDYSCSEVQFCP